MVRLARSVSLVLNSWTGDGGLSDKGLTLYLQIETHLDASTEKKVVHVSDLREISIRIAYMEFLGSKPQAILFLRFRPQKGNNMVTFGGSQLDCKMSETTDPKDCHSLSLLDAIGG